MEKFKICLKMSQDSTRLEGCEIHKLNCSHIGGKFKVVEQDYDSCYDAMKSAESYGTIAFCNGMLPQVPIVDTYCMECNPGDWESLRPNRPLFCGRKDGTLHMMYDSVSKKFIPFSDIILRKQNGECFDVFSKQTEFYRDIRLHILNTVNDSLHSEYGYDFRPFPDSLEKYPKLFEIVLRGLKQFDFTFDANSLKTYLIGLH